MTLKIKKSESTASLRRLHFILVDIADGFTPETGLSAGFTTYISKAGGSAASGAGSINEIDGTNMPGHYYYEFTTGEIDISGFLAINIRHASCRDVHGEIQIIDYNPYSATNLGLSDVSDIKTDAAAILLDTDTIEADLKTYLDTMETNLQTRIEDNDTLIDTAITDIGNLNNITSASVWAVGTREITGGVLTTPADYKATGFSVHSAADVWTTGSRALSTPNDYKATGFSTHNADAIWAVGSRVITGGILTTPNDYKANISALALEATVNALNNLSSGDIQTVIENNDLDHLIQVAAGVEKPTIDSYFDQLLNKDGSQTYDPTTDSLEAQVDAGGAGDWTANQKTEIATVLGITDTGTPDSTPSDGVLKEIQDNVDTLETGAYVQTILETNDLDHLLKVAHPSGDPIADTIFDLIMNKDGTQTFARVDDSLQGISEGAAGGGASAQEVWEYVGSRALTTPADYKATGFSTHVAADIWSVGTREITGGVLTTPNDYKATGFSVHVPADIWSVGSRVITGGVLTTPNDYKATGFSTHNESDVWSVVTRTITGGMLTTPNDYKATGFSVHNAADIWTTGSRELSTPPNYKADVSALALEATVLTIKALTDNLPADTELELIKLGGLGGIWLRAEYHHDENNDNDYIQFWQYGNQTDYDNETKGNAIWKYRQDITWSAHLPVKSGWDKVT